MKSKYPLKSGQLTDKIALKADLSDYQNTLTATGDIEIVDDEIDLKQIVKDDIALGVEANGWGNHAQAGYLKTADADEAYAPAQGYPDWALQLTDLLNF